MKTYKILAARIIDGFTKVFEIEAKSPKEAMKKFNKLFGEFWCGVKF